MLSKILAIRQAWKDGNYAEAWRLFYELIGDVTGVGGRSSDCPDPDECAAQLEDLEKDVQETGRAAGGVFLALFLQVLPLIIQAIKDKKVA